MRLALAAVLAATLVGCTSASPFTSPPPRPSLPHRHVVYVPIARQPAVWQAFPRYKFGVAAAYSQRSLTAMQAIRALPAYSIDGWDAQLQTARWAAQVGLTYFPRLQVIGRRQTTGVDMDGVPTGTGESSDLALCEPYYGQEAQARLIAQSYPGTMWSLFNEPDNLDMRYGTGCWDATIGGSGYTGYGANAKMTGPVFAYSEAAKTARYWILFIRKYDKAARFNCCGELYGSTAAYAAGVASAYRRLYGERMPLEAVSLHIYHVNHWNVETYKNDLRSAYKAVDRSPDLRGLPIMLNEGISLSTGMDSANKNTRLLYEWYDWLGLDENRRVVATAWWVDAGCVAGDAGCATADAWPGSRLFTSIAPSATSLSVVGKTWSQAWCNWLDNDLDPVAQPCASGDTRIRR
jgi:hypothetical protein